MKVTLTNLSICPCGFPLLDETIQIGQEYDIDPNHRITATLTCGGCHQKHTLIAVWVESRAGGRAGYLPEEVFARGGARVGGENLSAER